MAAPLATDVIAQMGSWTYAPPSKLQNGASMSFLRDGRGDTPTFQLCAPGEWSRLPFGVSEPAPGQLPPGVEPVKKNTQVELTAEFAAACEAMDEFDQRTAVANMDVWFAHIWNDKKKGGMYDTPEKREAYVRSIYKPSVKVDDEGKYLPNIKTKFVCKGNKATTVVVCTDPATHAMEAGSEASVAQRSQGKVIAERNGLWFNAAEWGPSINIKSMCVLLQQNVDPAAQFSFGPGSSTPSTDPIIMVDA